MKKWMSTYKMQEKELIQLEKELEFIEKRKSELLQRKREAQVEKEKKQKYLRAEERAWEEYNIRENGITVEVTRVSDDRFFVKTPYDEKLVAKFFRIRGREWDGKCTHFPLQSWESFIQMLKDWEIKTTLLISESIQTKVDEYNNRPNVNVFLDGSNIIMQTRGIGYRPVRNLSGVEYSAKHSNKGWESYKIPQSDILRVVEKLLEVPKVTWSEEALALVKEISERKAKLEGVMNEDESKIDCGVELQDITLRPFQKQAILFSEMADYNCIIAHEMGLGKTPISIADCVKYKEAHPNARFLFVIPGKLKTNWAREIRRFTGESATVYFKASPDQLDVERLLVKKPTWNIINYEIMGRKTEHKIDVMNADGTKVIAHSTVDRYLWAELLNMVNFDIIILDEAHYVKNEKANRSRACLSLKAPHYLPMTGTPILNRPQELWPMLNLIAPNRFPSAEQFKNRYVSNNGSARNVQELREILKTLMIRRTKKEVIKELPPINRIYQWHELTEQAVELYQDVLKGVYKVISLWNPEEAGHEKDVPGILAQIMRLKQVCAMDKINTVADLAVEVSDADDNGGKVIIFSNFVPVVEAIAKRLGNEAMVLHGQKKDPGIIDSFRDDPKVKFLVAQWQVGGEGHNLQCANNVIFSDLFWTPASHQQCEGRAYGRLADPHPINSYYVVIENTIEMWIQELLAHKLKTIESVVGGLKVDPSKSIVKELMLRIKRELKEKKGL